MDSLMVHARKRFQPAPNLPIIRFNGQRFHEKRRADFQVLVFEP